MEQLEKENKNEGDYEEVIQLYTEKDREDVYRNFGLLCTELKYLYVAITRPKTKLIIYDSDIEQRSMIYEYWATLGVVDI